FTVIGGAVHIGVDAIKQARSRSRGSSLLAIDDWLLWIHINESGIVIGIVSIWIGFFGLLFATGEINWETAFLVGYSVDSFIDLFLERFNTLATSRIGKMKF